MVARLVRDQEAVGSNPVSSTIKETSFVYHGKGGFLRAKGLKNSHFYAILTIEKRESQTGICGGENEN